MANVIVAFSKAEDAGNIKKILIRRGFSVSAVCTSGAQVLAQAGDFGSGIVVCGYRLADMLFTGLAEDLPSDFDLVMLAPPGRWNGQGGGRIFCLPMPLKVQELVELVTRLEEEQHRRYRRQKRQPKRRSEAEQQLIDQAKALLMERNQMTEEEAHRYIQKRSMDNGTGFTETAQMILSLLSA